MIFRFITANPSNILGGIGSHKANHKLFKDSYLCMVRSLSRSKVDFLCLLHDYLLNNTSHIEEGEACWLPKTFDEWASELGISDRTVNRIITSLRQEDLILTQKMAPHKTIRTNYYTINYSKLWKMIPESKLFFTSTPSGEAA